MQLVIFPTEGVGKDICASAVPFGFVSEHVLIVIALPNGGASGVEQGIDLAGGDGFEVLNDGAKGSGRHG